MAQDTQKGLLMAKQNFKFFADNIFKRIFVELLYSDETFWYKIRKMGFGD